jgi:hypothetical protein
MKQMLIVALLSIAVLPPGFSQSKESKMYQNEPKDLRQLNQRFGEAQVQRDTAQLDQLLADDFTLINPAGKVLSKLQFLADMSSGDLKYESLNYDDVRQRVYPDVAVVTGAGCQERATQGAGQ